MYDKSIHCLRRVTSLCCSDESVRVFTQESSVESNECLYEKRSHLEEAVEFIAIRVDKHGKRRANTGSEADDFLGTDMLKEVMET